MRLEWWEARRIIRDWVDWYNQNRPHALRYRSPVHYRAQKSTQVLDFRGALHPLVFELEDFSP
ncbi:MAG: transposase [Nitrospira sp.]|nr:transposase [Nitrospira sp.]